MITHQGKQSWEKWTRLERQDGLSSHWTIGLSEHWYLICLSLITLLHFFLSTQFPPAEDELYYWSWAQHLQWSYYDHPPLVAVLIALSTRLFGHSLFGIRFFANLGGFLVLAAMGPLTQNKQVLSLLLFTPIFFFGSILMTPDVPLLVFWTCYLLWFTRQIRTMSDWNEDPIARVYRKTPIAISRWLIGGVLLGLGLLSKYSMALAVPCSFVVLVARYRFRAWRTGFAVHLLVALLISAPILIYNSQNHFSPLLYQWQHSMVSVDFSFSRTLEFVGVQIVLLGALPFLMFPWCIVRAKEMTGDPRLQVCFYFFVLPFAFILYRTLRTPTEANWALICYVSFWPLAQRLIDRSSFKRESKFLVAVSFLTPMVCTLLILIHAITPLGFLKPERDRLYRLKAQDELAIRVAQSLGHLAGNTTVFCPNYQWTSYLRYHGVGALQLYPGSRMSHFTLPATEMCSLREVIVFGESTPPTSAVQCFTRQESIGTYPLVVRGQLITHFNLVRYTR